MIGITPNAIHICPPLSLRECKSGLKSLLLLHLATMIHYLSGEKREATFPVPSPMVTHPGLHWTFLPWGCMIWLIYLERFFSSRMVSPEALTLPRVATESLPYLHLWPLHAQLIYRYAHGRLTETLSPPHTQWHTYVDTHRHSHSQTLVHAEIHTHI